MPNVPPLGNYLKNINCQIWALLNHPTGAEPPNPNRIVSVYINYFNNYAEDKITLEDVMTNSDYFQEVYRKYVKD